MLIMLAPIGLMLLHKQCVSIRTAFIDGSTSMGEVILLYRKNKKLQKELLFAQKTAVVQSSNKLKEDDWFITYKDKTYLCVDCSYEMGENRARNVNNRLRVTRSYGGK